MWVKIAASPLGRLGLALAFWLTLGRVAAAPIVLDHPDSALVRPNENVLLSVVARGTGPLRYQWRLNGVNIPGAVNATLRIQTIAPVQAGSYTVVVADATGVTSSTPARVVVDLPELPFVDDFPTAALGGGVSPAEIRGFSGVGRGANVNASREVNEPPHAFKRGRHSVWLTWTPGVAGIARMNTHGSGQDTLLAVYAADGRGLPQIVAANDDRTRFHTSAVIFTTEPGVRYFIAVDGLAGDRGHIVFSWDLDRLVQDRVPKMVAAPESRIGAEGTQVTLSLTLDAAARVQWVLNDSQVVKDDPSTTGSTLDFLDLQRSRVGNYVARLITPSGVVIDSEPVRIQIHRRGDGRLVRDVSTDNKIGDNLGTFSAIPATLQGLRDSQPDPAGGVAGGYSGTQIFSTYGATTEHGEPHHCDVIGGASEWYTYTAESSGEIQIDTEGSDFDTVMAVYVGTGTDFSGLSRVACNNDVDPARRWSSATFQSTAGTTYYIAVDGVDGVTGTAHINYRMRLPPRLALAGSLTVDEDKSGMTPLGVLDLDGSETNLLITATSSDPDLLPPAAISISGSGTNRQITLTPVPNRSGSAVLTVTARDQDNLLATAQLQVSVRPINDAPMLVAPPGSVRWVRSTGPLLLNLTLADPDHPPESLTLTPSTPPGTVLPLGSVVFVGTGPVRTLQIQPTAGWPAGVTPLGLVVSDGGDTSTHTLLLEVVDSVGQPRLEPAFSVAGGVFRVLASGLSGRVTRLESSPDLRTWTTLRSFPGDQEAVEIAEPHEPAARARFFRLSWD